MSANYPASKLAAYVARVYGDEATLMARTGAGKITAARMFAGTGALPKGTAYQHARTLGVHVTDIWTVEPVHPELVARYRAAMALAESGVPLTVSGACAGAGPSTWFPDVGDRAGHVTPLAICAGCGVAMECLARSIRDRDYDGTYGGMSESTRGRIRAQLAKESVTA